jgi:hypothetical protein
MESRDGKFLFCMAFENFDFGFLYIISVTENKELNIVSSR